MNLVAAAVLAIVFGAVIARQTTGRGPPVWTLFVAGGFLTVVTEVLPPTGAEAAIAGAGPTLVFLFALFVFASALEAAGVLDHVARWTIGLARRPADLPFFLFVVIGLVSAILVNDALVLIGVPILLGVARRLAIPPKPLLFVLAFAVTVGSTLTPFGNPQNLLVAVQSGLPFPIATFFEFLALPTAINLLVGGWYLRWVYRRSMPADAEEFARARAEAPRLFPEGGWRRRLAEQPVIWVFPGTMLVLVTVDIVSALVRGPSVPTWEIALAGAVVLVLASPGRAPILQKVNWSILLLFAGLFVVVQGALTGGVVAAMTSYFPIPGPGHTSEAILAIVGTSLGGPQLVSNVPWVALQIPVLARLGYGAGTPVVWMALAAGSTLAGNVTLLGAVSNLILVDSAERHGVHIRLAEFVRHGLPVALITVAVLVACLVVGL